MTSNLLSYIQPKKFQQRYLLNRTPQKTVKYEPQSKRLQLSSSPQIQSSSSIKTKYPICSYHFNDSIYRGEMKAYQRKGKGVLLHDNGLCGIVRSGTNRLKGHNVFFGQNTIISIIYSEHSLDIVYKYGKNIMIFNMSKANGDYIVNSLGYMVQYDLKRVSKLKFKSNHLIEKVLFTVQQTKEIIQKQNLIKLMKEEHIEALKLKLFDKQLPDVDVVKNKQYQIHIGYMRQADNSNDVNYKSSLITSGPKKQLDGLGFVLQVIEMNQLNPFQLQFRILQRGFFSQGNIQYFGQQYYINENIYFGFVKDGKMHGKGIMIYNKQNKYTEGIFDQGKPIKLNEDPTYRLNTEEGKRKYENLRRSLHKQDTQIWIDSEFNDVPDPVYFNQLMQECRRFRHQDQQIINMQKAYEELKLSRKVQSFVNDSATNEAIEYVSFLDNSLYLKSARSKQQEPIHVVVNKSQKGDLSFGSKQKRQVNNLFLISQKSLTNPFNREQSLDDRVRKQVSVLNFSSRIKLNQDIPFIMTSPRRTDKPFTRSSLLQQSHSRSRSYSHSKSRSSSPYQFYPQSPIEKIRILGPIKNNFDNKQSLLKLKQVQTNKALQRETQLLKEYEKLQKQKYQMNKPTFKSSKKVTESNKVNQVGKIVHTHQKQAQVQSRPTLSPYKKADHNDFAQKLKQMNRKCILAANESIKLAHSNKIKQQKIQHYDHYTHKRKFNYTNQIEDNNASNQHLHNRTPEKIAKYSRIQDTNRTFKKHQVDNMINRLYPHNSQRISQYRSNGHTFDKNIYDSRYYQERTLGKNYINSTNERTQKEQISYNRNYYGKDYQSSVLRQNMVPHRF